MESSMTKQIKKTVRRTHIVPKKEKSQELVENYVVSDETGDCYTHYKKLNKTKSNAHCGAQHIIFSQWPLVETQLTFKLHTTIQTTYSVEDTPTKD